MRHILGSTTLKRLNVKGENIFFSMEEGTWYNCGPGSKSCLFNKVVLNCLKYTKELELMILKILNYRGVIDNVQNH